MGVARASGVGLAWLLLFSSACTQPPVDLYVEVITDFVPGPEFSVVQTELIGEAVREHTVRESDQFVPDGVQVAGYTDLLPNSQRRIRVALLDRTGAEVAARTALIRHRTTQAVALVLARSCAEVRCEGPGQTCVNGTCQDEGCLTGLEPECDSGRCESDAACATPAAGCAQAACVRGACLSRGDGVSCTAEEYCHPTDGCVPRAICGDGTVEAPEACDDGATRAGDGCDDSCQTEPGFLCEGAPSVCRRPEEILCNDGLDDDGDGDVDCDDTACARACEMRIATQCVAPNRLVAVSATGLPLEIFDREFAPDGMTLMVQSVETEVPPFAGQLPLWVGFELSLDHPALRQLDILLLGPGVVLTEAVEFGEISGTRAEHLLIASFCTEPLASLAEPYTACAVPSEPLDGHLAQEIGGTWSILVADSVDGGVGTLEASTFVFCLSE